MRTGSRLLQVVSIIILVFCSLTLLVGILFMVGFSALGSMLESMLGAAAAGGAAVASMIVVIILIILLFAVGLQFVAAILGIKNWSQPDKATPCIVLGIIMLVFAAIGALSLFSRDQILPALLGLPLPVLYVVGAFQLKKMNTYTAPAGVPPAGYGAYPPQAPGGYPPAGYGAYPPQDPGGYPPAAPDGYPPAGYGGAPPAAPDGFPPAGYDAYPPQDPGGYPPQDPGGYPTH